MLFTLMSLLVTFLTTQVPVSSSGTSANELGVQITSSIAGRVTAIRFYKMSGDPGPHIGHLWSGTGQLLSTVSFQNETVSGWQEQAIPPVAIAISTIFVVSVNNPAGAHYATIKNGFSKPIINSNLTATTGVYAATGKYPNTKNPDNYFRDVVFDTSVSTETISTGLTNGTAATGRMLIPGVANGLKVGNYTVNITLTDSSGRVVFNNASIQVMAFPFLAGDSNRSWAYTWVTSIGETLPSTVFTVAGPLVGGPFYAQVGSVAIGPSGTIARNIYRTNSGGTQLKFVGRVNDNTTTVYDDHIADIDLGINAPITANAPAPSIAPTVSIGSIPQ